MSQNLERLKRLLAELFQLDQAELDFGIYRIMNAKRAEVTRFLNNDLLPQVRKVLSDYEQESRLALQEELDKAKEQARSLGFEDPAQAPKVKELQARYNAAFDVEAAESEVFSHLYNFFRRYYQEGDFISLRRYKEGVYAIPYEGEEVKLYWANHDQYYIKTSEYLRNYTFKLPSGKRVHFKLVEADTEKDNNRPASGNERRFILSQEQPLAEENGELVIRFEYRPHPDKAKQADLNAAAVNRILKQITGFADWRYELASLRPTEKNPNRTLLEKHLAEYTARNTFDYFIHKDLDGFLRRELDFYIKNEVMYLDDIESETAPRVEQYLSKIKAIRRIAHKIIDFLAQIENFQKKLWLKKKFVVETQYCVTLDRVPEELYPEIAANEAQREEWIRLFAIDEITGDLTTPGYSKPLTVEFLKANPHLVLDTRHFSEDFKRRLLASFDDLDEQCDGLVIHSENFQALYLLMERYKEQVKCIYIDPPYNTGDDGFAYKDQYRHSSWITMLTNRFSIALPLLRPQGVAFVSIDDNEFKHLWYVLGDVLGVQNYLGSMVWKRRSASALSSQPLSLDHEYVLVYGRDARLSVLHGLSTSEDDYPYTDESGRHYASTDLTVGMTKEQRPNQFYPIRNPRTGKVFLPNPNRVWRFFPETMQQVIAQDLVIWPDEAEGNLERPRYKTYFDPESMRAKPCSSWIETANTNDREIQGDETDYGLAILQSGMNSEGGRIVDRIFGERTFAYPKPLSLLRSLVRAATRDLDTVCDFFAGSGTTAHAVISLNQEDGGRRKYILVEMGEYLDTVLVPRIKKVVYSKDWKDGKPVSREGSSHMFKVLRLESYEDTLNNLELRRTGAQQRLLEEHAAFREDYLLRYMLDVESRGSGSFLNLDRFEDPFSYTLDIATGTAGETKPTVVDLVETFNYLIGLRVKTIDDVRGVRFVTGTNPQGERVLILWRNVKEVDNDKLDDWFKKQGYNTRDQEYDVIYVNGDNNLENIKKPDQTWKVRLIEEEFLRRMFDVADV
jgi:adenine-specific DNA-methyltransferase